MLEHDELIPVFIEESQQRLGLFGIMGGVLFGYDIETAVTDDILDGGGADIDPKCVVFFHALSFVGIIGRFFIML